MIIIEQFWTIISFFYTDDVAINYHENLVSPSVCKLTWLENQNML